MNIFPVLEKTIQFEGAQEDAVSKLRELVQIKKYWIETKYTKPFYGTVLNGECRFRLSRWHSGFYWVQAQFETNEFGTSIQFRVFMPKWRRIAYLVILTISILASMVVPFFVTTWKELYISFFPLLFAWGAWNEKRDDFRRYAQFMPSLLNAFTSISPSSAT